ncbi:helix-turn-helix transcriptional regulator [Vibrio tubiashii]|uniref:Phage transcriptional regulator, AlpA n=1 Tax=Vibrio tubiashii ATCC 19109 TaxID=1051646 RepID=A0ABP2LM73_9VIBR|nr:helix-turn-helix domain-containing protein [Vibrio tubiashii]EGU56070.1 phage transcriptional regulator, AlpA [Vibrio tubiashii ATCC 19109]EIF04282.1 phage transcriptional regulator AlpA [Vibrio tubiashii NCIMB 1337 = ATCC 19106]
MNPILTTREVCRLIKRTPATLYRWWKSGRFPRPLRHNGRAYGWDKDAVDNWLKHQSE